VLTVRNMVDRFMVCSLSYNLKLHKGCVVACSLARRRVRRVSRGMLCGIVRCAMSYLLGVAVSLLCINVERKKCRSFEKQRKDKM
jgi:hypothetical protein